MSAFDCIGFWQGGHLPEHYQVGPWSAGASLLSALLTLERRGHFFRGSRCREDINELQPRLYLSQLNLNFTFGDHCSSPGHATSPAKMRAGGLLLLSAFYELGTARPQPQRGLSKESTAAETIAIYVATSHSGLRPKWAPRCGYNQIELPHDSPSCNEVTC